MSSLTFRRLEIGYSAEHFPSFLAKWNRYSSYGLRIGPFFIRVWKRLADAQMYKAIEKESVSMSINVPKEYRLFRISPQRITTSLLLLAAIFLISFLGGYNLAFRSHSQTADAFLIMPNDMVVPQQVSMYSSAYNLERDEYIQSLYEVIRELQADNVALRATIQKAAQVGVVVPFE